jgi:DNA/RNA endonuclease YhcR with UshA esterase domain
MMEATMKRTMTGWLAMLVLMMSAGSVMAHHSLANHDTTTPVRVKGTVVQVQRINPHSFIFLEQTGADGARQRWAVEGPSGVQLARRGDPADGLKPGDVIEVCGYVTKEKTMWQIASRDPQEVSLAGRLITAELLVMPDGTEKSWGDYGFHKCFAPGYKDQHSR